MAVEIGAAELKLVLILLCVVVVPIAGIAFARSGKGLENLGKGAWSIDREAPPAPGESAPATDPAEREAEVRQMVEAAAYRRQARGEAYVDVDAETDRLLKIGPEAGPAPDDPVAGTGQAGVREEIRQLVIANNERRVRRGEEPLDVKAEVERRLREWT